MGQVLGRGEPYLYYWAGAEWRDIGRYSLVGNAQTNLGTYSVSSSENGILMIQNLPYETCALIRAVASQDKSEANNSLLLTTDNRKVLQDQGRRRI